MSRVPDEPPSWPTDAEAADAARALREQLAATKAKVKEHRAQLRAAGLTAPDHATDPPEK
jgi:hypothetical protein